MVNGLRACEALTKAHAGSLALDGVVRAYDAAVRAYRAMRPNAGFHKSVGGLVVMEMCFGSMDLLMTGP